MNTLKEIIYRRNTVNSIDKSIHTVNKLPDNSGDPVWNEVNEFIASKSITPEGVALHLAEKLNDEKSLKYYLLLAKEHNHGRLLDALHQTMQASGEGRIRTKKAIYFQAILRYWGLKTKFKD